MSNRFTSRFDWTWLAYEVVAAPLIWLTVEYALVVMRDTSSAGWFWKLALVGVVDATALGGLVFLARRQEETLKKLRRQTRQRARELAQLGAGLAHEIRNPLHALRINLHTLLRSFGGRSPLPEDQLVATIQESDASIDCLDELMRDLLQFVDPSAGEPVEVDLVHEVQATLNLLSEDLRREQISVRSALPHDPATIAIDPARLRQALLNVLTFAQHRAGRSGAIDIQVERCEGGVQIAIGDSGPALAEEQRARLFEPFQAPAETGSGLGLALVQTYVEEAGGRVSWVHESGTSGHCRLWFPLASKSQKGGPS